MNVKTLLKTLHEETDWRALIFHSSWTLTATAALSYFFGFVRDRLLAQTFGLSRTLDIYNAAFVIPDLMLNVLIGTTLSAAFLPIFIKQYDQKRALGNTYAHQVLSWGLLLMITIGIVVAITLPGFARYLVPGFEGEDMAQYVQITRIFLLSPVLFTLSNTYGRILASKNEFLWYGLSPALYNMGIVLGIIVLVPYFGLNGLVIGTLIGVVLHLLIRFVMVRGPKFGFRNRLDFHWSPELKETIKLTMPKIMQYFMWYVMLLSFTNIASILPEGSVAVYNYARNFQSIPVSLLGIAIAFAMYTSLAHDAGRGNFKKFEHDFKNQRFRCVLYTTLAAMALAAFSMPLVRLLLGGGQFGEDQIELLSNVIRIYAFAVPLESMLHIYHRTYYSIRNTIIPSVSHAVTTLGIVIAAKILAPTIGIYAIPASFAGGLAVHITILAIIFPFVFRRHMAMK
ncbi:MAG: lipid II flippase MurJ [Candidatus Peregrinibacteria bacterium]